MTPPQIRRLLEARQLEEAAFTDEQLIGLWSKAAEAYHDSFARPRSRNGQFRDLYEAGRIAATTLVAAAGYRPRGPSHHYAALQAAAALTPEPLSEAVFVVEGARGHRHETNYGSADVLEEEDLREMRAAVELVLGGGAKLLREWRPGLRGRVREPSRGPAPGG